MAGPVGVIAAAVATAGVVLTRRRRQASAGKYRPQHSATGPREPDAATTPPSEGPDDQPTLTDLPAVSADDDPDADIPHHWRDRTPYPRRDGQFPD